MMIKPHSLCLLLLLLPSVHAEEAGQNPSVESRRQAFNGIWILNVALSDDTDKQVEKAIKKAGGKVKRVKKKGKYKYKGGPKDHELYDHASYDEAFLFDYQAPKVRLAYLEKFTREFYTDGRGRSASASGGEVKDYAFASWEGEVLYVEARPRDGGKTDEVYSLINAGTQLKAVLDLRPLNFGASVQLTRIFDRQLTK